jgi:cold shock CspA family protein
MREGTILFFDPYKGFGKIKSHDTNEEIFVYIKGLVHQVYKDNIVTFKTETLNGKEQAVDVRLKNTTHE